MNPGEGFLRIESVARGYSDLNVHLRWDCKIITFNADMPAFSKKISAERI